MAKSGPREATQDIIEDEIWSMERAIKWLQKRLVVTGLRHSHKEGAKAYDKLHDASSWLIKLEEKLKKDSKELWEEK